MDANPGRDYAFDDGGMTLGGKEPILDGGGRWTGSRRWRFGAVMVLLGGALAVPATAGDTLEERKQPMHFVWHDRATLDGADRACGGSCKGIVAAVGTVTADTPQAFADFAAGRDLRDVTMVLDSSGGSVLDAIAIGRQWRALGVATTVGIVNEMRSADTARANIVPEAYCESMCAFLLLSGAVRHVPAEAHVRVHQIWMGDRTEDARSASYTAQDVSIIERDIGRLASFTFEMGGSGELLALALGVPPWEPLHELTANELRQTGLVPDQAMARLAPAGDRSVAAGAKPIQDRFVAAPGLGAGDGAGAPAGRPSTRTAEAGAPTGVAVPRR